MTQQYLKHTFRALLCPRQISPVGKRRPAAVFYSDQCNRIFSAADNAMVVHQHLPAHLFFPHYQRINICQPLRLAVPAYVSTVIVITQYRKHAVFGMQLRKDWHKLLHLVGTTVYQIARKHGQIGMLSVAKSNSPLQGLRISFPASGMDIGQLKYPVTVERSGKIGRRESNLFYLKVLLTPDSTKKNIA